MSDDLIERESTASSSLAWFLTGAVIGVTAAMLYAPRSGREMRRGLAETAARGKDSMTDTGKDIVETGREMFERGRKLVEDAAELFEQGRKLVRG